MTAERWEGCVTDIGDEVFTADIVSPDGDRMTAEFYRDRVAEADLDCLASGALFEVIVDDDGPRIEFRRWKPLEILTLVGTQRALQDIRELRAIEAARADGATWEQIGRALGYEGETIRQAALARAKRLRKKVDATLPSWFRDDDPETKGETP